MRINGLLGSLWGMIWLSLKRLRNLPELTVGLLAGLVTIVALVAAVPAYIDAANNRLLQGELATGGNDRRSGLTFLYQYSSQAGLSMSYEQFRAVDSYLAAHAASAMGLPVKHAGLYVHSDRFVLFPPDAETLPPSERQAVGQMQAGFMRHLAEHIMIVEGRLPAPATPGAPIEVLVSENQANQMYFQPGEEFLILHEEMELGAEEETTRVTERFQDRVRVVGIWRPIDEKEAFWFLSPKTLDEVLLMPEESYIERFVDPKRPYTLAYAGWHLIFDGGKIQARDVPALLGRIGAIQSQLIMLLPDIAFPLDPVWPLRRYQLAVDLQTRILLAFGLPLFSLALAYVIFVSTLSIRQQRLEITLLKSRGASSGQIVLLYLIQSVFLGLVALGVGLLFGRALAQAMAHTRSFLGFGTQAEGYSIKLTASSLQFSIMAVTLAVFFCLLPSFYWARLTIVTFKSFLSRLPDRPWWQRQFLDIVLLTAALYGYYVLKRQGGLPFLLGGRGDPLQNPLLLLAPSFFALAIGLLFLRVFPFLMRLLHWFSQYLNGSIPFLSFGRLARSAGYSSVLLLLVLTVSLSVFTASLALTLDTNVVQRAYYRVGADLSLQESTAGGGIFSLGQKGASEEEEVEDFVFIPPASDAEQVPGVWRATRVVPLSITAAGERGMALGVDRLSLPGVAFFRRDFARRSLGSLMNALARDPQGALVNDSFLAARGLQVGDLLRVQVNNPQRTEMQFFIVGTVHLFPTFYLGESGLTLLLIANTEYLEEQFGYPLTGQLWLRVDPNADVTRIVEQVKEVGYHISAFESAREEIAREQSRLERVGLFGFLSLGFTIISFLSMLCLVFYALVSLRQWTIQFGILRAIGLTPSQLVGIVVLEQSTIVLLGLVAGAALGIWLSYLFLPFLQVTYAEQLPLPPMTVEVAWESIWRVYAIVGSALLIAVAGMGRSLRQIRMFEAIKMGEAQTL